MARNRRKSRERREVLVGYIAGAIGAVVLVALGAAWYFFQSQATAIDQATQCPTAGPAAVHAVLVDRSDPITPQQAQRVKQELQRLIAAAKAGERFDLYVVEGDSANTLSPVVSVCSPGRGADANRLYQNPEQIQQRFDQQFVRRLEGALDGLLTGGARPNSPIIESIRAAAITSFGSVQLGSVPLQMTVISDLVQHSPANSHFRGEISFNDLSRKPIWREIQPNLRGAKVRFLYLLRASARRPNGVPIQNRGHQAFWEHLVEASGGEWLPMETL